MKWPALDTMINCAECHPPCGESYEEVLVPVYPGDAPMHIVRYEDRCPEGYDPLAAMAVAAWEANDDDTISDVHMSMPLLLQGRPSPCPSRKRSVSWAQEESSRSRGRSRGYSAYSIASTTSTGTTGTVQPNEVARMTFDLGPGEHIYDEDHFGRVASIQPDGTVVITGLFTPLAATMDGHTGVLPGDTIQQVIDSSNDLDGEIHHKLGLALLNGGGLNLLVATRPKQFEVEIACVAGCTKKLGLQAVIEREYGDRIKAQTIHEHGLLFEWNCAHPKCQVMPGDWITSVNRKANGAQAMANDIRNPCQDHKILLTIETRPRMMHGDVGCINLGSNPKSHRKLPPRARVETDDWTQMRHAESCNWVQRRKVGTTDWERVRVGTEEWKQMEHAHKSTRLLASQRIHQAAWKVDHNKEQGIYEPMVQLANFFLNLPMLVNPSGEAPGVPGIASLKHSRRPGMLRFKDSASAVPQHFSL